MCVHVFVERELSCKKIEKTGHPYCKFTEVLEIVGRRVLHTHKCTSATNPLKGEADPNNI
jgi:hypothetical protein